MTVEYLVKGKKKGVFLSLSDWNSIKKELESLHLFVEALEKRRDKILRNYKKAKKEKHHFSSDISELKASLK